MEDEKIDGKLKMLMEYMETRFNQIDEKFEKVNVRFVNNEMETGKIIDSISTRLDKLNDLLDFMDNKMIDLEHEIRQLSITLENEKKGKENGR